MISLPAAPAHRRAAGAPQVSHKMVWHHMPDVFAARLIAAARAGLGGPASASDPSYTGPPAASEDASARDAGSGGGGGGGRGGGALSLGAISAPGDQGRGRDEMRRPLLSSGVPR